MDRMSYTRSLAIKFYQKKNVIKAAMLLLVDIRKHRYRYC